MHQVRVEPEDEDLGVTERPGHADAVGERRPLVILGDEQDVPADFLDVRDQLPFSTSSSDTDGSRCQGSPWLARRAD